MTRVLALAAGLLLWAGALAAPASGQAGSAVRLEGPSGERDSLPVARHRGYAAVPFRGLERLGWTVRADREGVRARLGEEGATLELRPGSPYLTWDGEVVQLVDAVYFFRDRLHVPVQLFSGVLPRRMEEAYGWDPETWTLEVLDGVRWTPRRTADGERAARGAAEPAAGEGEAAAEAGPEPWVVVIDPGHGGRDIGTQGHPGVVEKDVALSVARAVARELEDDPRLEVHLTRTDDGFVPLWERGEMATRWKGEHPGVFVSIHANASPRSRTTRGFEVYFLSYARTEHERRVAALENASLDMEEGERPGRRITENPDLDFILKDLRTFDQHWSKLLAQLVERELAPVHPGPNRGVKQAPFAVITNALMPAVLVELGFLSNSAESRLLAQQEFHRDAARAIAAAVRSFFERYPPGADTAIGGE